MMSCVQPMMEIDQDDSSSVLVIDSDEEEVEDDFNLEGEELTKVLKMLNMTDKLNDGVLVLNEDAVQERAYQTELVRLAIKRNIIVCLPTGSGKTFIALQLTKHYLHEAICEGRKIIFLAETVMLAHQQAAYFESRLTNFCLDDEQSKIVQCLTGDFDGWNKSDWEGLLSKCHVIVMTTAILVRALNLQHIQFKDIKLLVLDECHHAVKDDPMNQIMVRYRESIQDNKGKLDLKVLPRVLGLTATIICGKGKSYDVEKEVEEAEKRLCAKAVTYHRYEEVLKYSTSAKVKFIYHETSDLSQESLIKDLLTTKKQVDNCLVVLCSENDSGIQHESLRSSSQLYNKPMKLKKLKIITSCIKDVGVVYSELGLYCARWTAIHYRAFLRTALENRVFERIDVQVGAVDTALELFISRAEKMMHYQEKELDGGRGQYHAMMNFRTDKVAKVVQHLESYRNGKDLRGLIFMQQRTTTQALCWYLQDLSELPEFSFLKVGFVVGLNTWNKDPIEARITLNGQRDVIDGFRNGMFNLLVATSILEEGLDVPCCNLVMRLDKIYNYPSYVQSMGRARHEQSTFLGFVEKRQDEEQYKDFQAYNERLSRHLRANALHADDADETSDTFCAPGEKILPDFEPVPGGPRISATDAIAITQMYCQTLPCDRFATLSPEYWWDEVPDKEAKMFKAYMQFPTNAIVREVIEGELQRSKTLAKRSVALKACQILYEKGLLDARLLPMRKKLTEVINKFMDSLNLDTESVGKEKVGTRKRMQWYRKQIPRALANAEIHPGVQLFAYKVQISLLNDLKGNLSRLYNFSMSEFSYCFLTTSNLLEVPDFVLKVNSSIGEVKVNFEQISFTNHHLRFNAQELVELWAFHRYLFSDLLQLKHALLKDFPGPVLVAPVKKSFGLFGHEIDWDLMRKLSQMPGDWFQPPEQSRQRSFTFRREDYEDAVVVPWHDPSQEVYKNFHVVLNVLPETPASPFPNKPYHSYESYYTEKYPLVSFLANKTQKLLRAKKIGQNLNFFVPDVRGKKLKEPQDYSSTIELIPELTHLHPLPGSLYVQAKFLPSILQRTYRLLCANELRDLIAVGTPWESSSDRRTCVTEELASLRKRCRHEEDSPSSLQKKKKMSEEDIELSKVVSSLHVNCQPVACGGKSNEEKSYVLDLIHPRKLTTAVIDNIRSRMVRFRNARGDRGVPITVTSYQNVSEGLTDIRSISFKSLDKGLLYRPEEQPSLYMIMQALTMDGSQESVNLERLEMIGDSMLKYAVSRHIFSKFQDFDEGYLTEWRSSLISNRHLYKHGKNLKLSGYLAGGIFEPKCAWVPPGFCISPTLTDALIENGVNEDIFSDVHYLELESEEMLVEHMKTKNGIKNFKKMPDNVGYAHARIGDKSIADSVEALIGAYFISGGIDGALHVMNKIGLRGPENSTKDDDGSVGVPFGQWDHAYMPVYEAKNDSVMNHLPRYGELEKLICYKFKQPWLLVEAFSHPGYKRNRTTSCYQRLEFIGDAVLDFLVTNHIYNADAGLTPGQLTDLRSALVNNVTFGSLAVRYGLHTYLLNNDKSLDDAISFFVKCQQACGHQVTGHFDILSDAECAVVKDVSCPKVLGDIWESLAGAVFIDSGMSLDETWRVFYRLMEHEVVSFSTNVPKSPVRELYELFGSKIFKDITDTVEAHQDNKPKGYRYVALNVPMNDNLISVIGIGKNLTSAKLAAAKYCMKIKRRI